MFVTIRHYDGLLTYKQTFIHSNQGNYIIKDLSAQELYEICQLMYIIALWTVLNVNMRNDVTHEKQRHRIPGAIVGEQQ